MCRSPCVGPKVAVDCYTRFAKKSHHVQHKIADFRAKAEGREGGKLGRAISQRQLLIEGGRALQRCPGLAEGGRSSSGSSSRGLRTTPPWRASNVPKRTRRAPELAPAAQLFAARGDPTEVPGALIAIGELGWRPSAWAPTARDMLAPPAAPPDIEPVAGPPATSGCSCMSPNDGVAHILSAAGASAPPLLLGPDGMSASLTVLPRCCTPSRPTRGVNVPRASTRRNRAGSCLLSSPASTRVVCALST